MNDLLYNVESIYDSQKGYLALHKKEYYNIPLYQRGYKWTSSQVSKLLTDIHKFKPKAGKFYCVQNITIIPREEGYFNVVDGQQRLTTITLILACLGDQKLIKHIVRFPQNSIREMTNKFINEFIASDGNDIGRYANWDDFISENSQFDHQDIFFLFEAYHTIKNWFSEKSSKEIEDFRIKIKTNVKFIVNNIFDNNEVKIFGNLNSKRIYLDGADLIRAILITRVTEEEATGENAIKDIIVRNERRIRIGWILDEINNWWSDPEIKLYFKQWVNIQTEGDVSFNLENHPINLLYCLFAESEGWKNLSLEVIEEFNASKLYRKINRLNSILQDWYNDKEIYHFLGFLFSPANNNITFKDVWDKWNDPEINRNDFKEWLIKNINQTIFGKDNIDSKFWDNKNWYEGDHNTLLRILLLLDIIEANKESKDKLKPIAFFKDGNDIEHIFPQTPQEVNSEAQWEKLYAYINFLKEYDDEVNKISLISSFDPSNRKEESKLKILEFLKNYQQRINVHSIGNLVLLYYSLNRSLSNKPYAYKRSRILSYFNDGNYIQPHTLKVISRYFATDESSIDAMYWRNEDIIANEECIKETLRIFFKI